MRSTIWHILWLIFLTHCVPGPAHDDNVARSSITLTANGKSKLLPDGVQSPGFSELKVDVFSADAVIDAASNVTPGGPLSLGSTAMQSASPSCEVTGCQWRVSAVPTDSTLMGLMSAVTDTRAQNKVWSTTYTMVVNHNQILDNAKLGAPVSGFAPSFVVSQASVEKLAALVGIDSTTLVARGVCLGLVWSTRGEGTGLGTGFAGARITLKDTGAALPSLFYLDDALNNLSMSGTNRDGVFVLVGPPLDQAAVVSDYQVPLVVQNAVSAGTFADSYAIVRPGLVTVVPIIPRR